MTNAVIEKYGGHYGNRKECMSDFAVGEVDLSCIINEDNGRESFPGK